MGEESGRKFDEPRLGDAEEYGAALVGIDK